MPNPETRQEKEPAKEAQPMSEEKQARLEEWKKSGEELKALQMKLEKEYKEKSAKDEKANSPEYKKKEKEEFNAKKREDPTAHPTTLDKEKAMNSFFKHGEALPGDTAKQLTAKGDKIEAKDLDALVGIIDGEIGSYRKKVNDFPIPGVFGSDDLKGAEKRRLQDIVDNGGLPAKAKAYIQEYYRKKEKEPIVQK